MKKYKKTLSVIGLGYIGLPFLLCLTKSKYNLIGVDKNLVKLNSLKNKTFITEENEVNSLFKNINKKRISYSNKIEKSDIYILCLPTPLGKGKSCDLRILDNVINNLEKKLKDNDIVIIESTVPIGFTENIIKKIKKRRSDLKNLSFAYVCEKAMPGNTLNEMTNNERIIACENKDKSKLKKIYKSFVKGNIIFTDFKTAEAIKLVENTFRDFNIGLTHYLKNILEKKNLNYNKVLKLSNKHPRVNLLEPSIGVGGHCLPVDPYFLDSRKSGLISIIRSINDKQTKLAIKKLSLIIKKHKNKKICFWGLGYKVDSLDLRNSPAYKIYKYFSGEKRYASEIKKTLNVKNFIEYKSALKEIKFHVLLNVSLKNQRKYFKNKVIIKL